LPLPDDDDPVLWPERLEEWLQAVEASQVDMAMVLSQCPRLMLRFISEALIQGEDPKRLLDLLYTAATFEVPDDEIRDLFKPEV
jgi:hypothetical protein